MVLRADIRGFPDGLIAVMSTVPVMGLVTMMSVVPWNLEGSDFSDVHDEFDVSEKLLAPKKVPKLNILFFLQFYLNPGNGLGTVIPDSNPENVPDPDSQHYLLQSIKEIQIVIYLWNK